MIETNKMKKNWYLISVLVLLVAAFVLRFYKLGKVPHGMTWDEAAIGYNGYAMLTTRRDEWLNRFPVSFQSFGDYKAPLAIYLNGFSTYIFGMNLFAVRLPFALAGILLVLGFVFLTRLVFIKNKNRDYYSIFAGLLVALSPWHFYYSRTGFESGLALTFTVWGIYFLFKSLENKFKNIFEILLGIFLFVLSLYTYHSSKIVLPIFILAIVIIFRKDFFKNFKKLLFPVLFGGMLSYPLLKDTFFGSGLTRASVTIFSDNLSLLEIVKTIFANFIAHLSPGFLVFGETTTLRHGVGSWGVLFPTTLILVILGISLLILKKFENKYLLLFSLLILVGIFPAAIASEIPHSNRAFLAFPGFIMVAIYGFDFLIQKVKQTSLNKKALGSHGEKDIVLKSVVGTFLMFHFLLFYSFLNFYFNDFAKLSADDFKDGYLEALSIARDYEKGFDVEKVDKIIFTSDYGQPYIYALFTRKTNPIWYRGGSLNTYQFSDEINISDLSRKNTLVVGSASDELPTERADHLVYGSDGTVRFQIFRTE